MSCIALSIRHALESIEQKDGVKTILAARAFTGLSTMKLTMTRDSFNGERVHKIIGGE